MKKVFIKHEDPAHGWLKVPVKLLNIMGIWDSISKSSYMTTTDAFLEEDCDMPTFIESYKIKFGVDPIIRTRHTDHECRVRKYASYNPQLVENPVVHGSFIVVEVLGKKDLALVLKERTYYVIKGLRGEEVVTLGYVLNKDLPHFVTNSFEEGDLFCEDCHNTEDFTCSAVEHVLWLIDKRKNWESTLDGGDCNPNEDYACFKCNNEEVTKIPAIGMTFVSNKKKVSLV